VVVLLLRIILFVINLGKVVGLKPTLSAWLIWTKFMV